MPRPLLRVPILGIATALALTLAISAPQFSSATPPDGDLTPAQRQALELGVQLPAKGSAKSKKASVNPYLANLPDLKAADYAGWRNRLASQAKNRAGSSQLAAAKRTAVGGRIASPVLHDEEEPAGTTGSNDEQANAEPIAGFGTGRRENPRTRILGQLTDLRPPAEAIEPAEEDNGSIPLAADTGIDSGSPASITTTGEIGDGPHGSDGDGTGDFDFYKLSATAGRTVIVDTAGSDLDTMVAIFSAEGEELAFNDDARDDFTSLVSLDLPADGDYFVLVTGFFSFPEDPTDSGSGFEAGDEGPYELAIAATEVDTDFYSVDLAKGDVLGGSVTGGSSRLTVYRPDGEQMIASQQDASSIYPTQSPLPGGGNAVFAYVAEEPGPYAVRVDSGFGNYDLGLEAYRPGSQIDTASRVQTVFLDFDGARVNTGIWGGPGVRTLSPFSAFIAKWGLTRAQEAALIDGITAEVRENIRRDLIEQGLNRNLEVRVINSKDQVDTFGSTNVSRVVVGGTIAQSGVETIGIAQSIDPGNYAHEETALLLLDLLSDRGDLEEAPYSLNSYMNASSDRVAFVSQAVGNVVAHEVGHMIGSFHTDSLNETPCLMDEGGVFDTMFGVGPDGIGGTADDIDVDFVEDDYSVIEGFTGLEDTLNVSAWAFVRGGQQARP
jgi:hypothetical protein